MNSMDLVRSFSFLDDELISDAASDVPESGKAGAGGVKSPKPPKRPMSAKVKAIVISVCAVVAAAAIVLVILFTTGVFASKQVPIYKGMTISSATTSADTSSSASLASASVYGGDYKGKYNGIDKSDPFGNGSSAYMDAYESTLTVTGSSESIYYANEGESIYVTILFDNPDYYDIESFILSDGTTEIHYSDYMFITESSNYERITVQISSEYVHVGVTEYTISQIKYIDGEDIKDVEIGGETVVTCGVRSSSDMVTGAVTDEAVTLTSISFTATIVDTYSLISYSGGFAQAILYDGEDIVQTKDLSVGSNSVVFSDLTTDTVYQYAIVVYYDDLTGSGNVISYLDSGAVSTAAEVLFDNVDVGQEGVTFIYSWYEDYANKTITQLTITGNGTTTELTASATSVSGLYSDTSYTLTAYYVDVNGDRASITLTFTTQAKTVPTVTITAAADDLTKYVITVDDPDDICTIKQIMYQSDTYGWFDTSDREITISAVTDTDKQVNIEITYTYNLNKGGSDIEMYQAIYITNAFALSVNSVSPLNTGVITSGTNIMLEANIYNPYGVTVTKAVINNVTYDVTTNGTSEFYVTIPNNDQFETGSTMFILSQIICTYNGTTYTVNVSQNNAAAVYILNDELGEIAVTGVSLAYYSNKQYVDVTEEYYYKLDSKTVFLKISIDNPFNNTVSTVTYSAVWDYYGGGSNETTAYGVVMSGDYQKIYVPVGVSRGSSNVYGNGWVYATVKSISYTNGSKSASLDVGDYTVSWYDLGSSEEVEISTAQDFIDMLIMDNSGNYISKYYKLVNDIDLSGYNWATVVDYMLNGLNGVLDGNGYTISGLTYESTVNSDGDNVYGGLFGKANGLVINLKMTGVSISVTNNTAQENVIGLLASGSDYELRVYNSSFEYSARITNTKLGTVVTTLGLVGSGSASICNTTITNTASGVVTTYTEQNGYLIATATDGNVYLTGYIGDETDLVVPDGVTAISDYAFAGSSITSIVLSSSVKTIGNYAFSECDSLTSITMSDSLTSIGDNAFWCCRYLTAVTLPDSLTTIGDNAFSVCDRLTSINLPGSLTSIGEYAFSCAGISNVVIPDGITTISSGAFDNCHQIMSIVIPDSVTTIEEVAFNACSNLSSVYYEGTAAQWSNVSISSTYNDSLSSATVYYYSEEQPTESGNYWHYAEGVATAW